MIDSLAFANYVKYFEYGCFRPGYFIQISNNVEIMFDGEFEHGNTNGGSETWFKFTFSIDNTADFEVTLKEGFSSEEIYNRIKKSIDNKIRELEIKLSKLR